MSDIVVLGGGPAGSSSAIHLARRGARVRLYEKKRFPRPKLCGGFLSGESEDDLNALGVLPDVRQRAHAIHRVEVSVPSGRRTEAPLQRVGYSISRHVFDALLLEKAKQAGVDVIAEDGRTSAHKGDFLIMASGRTPHSPRRGWYGFQAYFKEVPSITDQVALDFVAGGYLGWVRQGEGVNLCGLIDHATMRRFGPGLDALVKNLAKTHSPLRQRLFRATRISSWLAVGPVSMGRRTLTQTRTLLVGDAACVVDPFAGQGIAMALRSGGLAAQALQHLPTATATYAALWEGAFGHPLRWQGLLRRLTQYRWSQETLSALLSWHPTFLQNLTHYTRPV